MERNYQIRFYSAKDSRAVVDIIGVKSQLYVLIDYIAHVYGINIRYEIHELELQQS